MSLSVTHRDSAIMPAAAVSSSSWCSVLCALAYATLSSTSGALSDSLRVRAGAKVQKAGGLPLAGAWVRAHASAEKHASKANPLHKA